MPIRRAVRAVFVDESEAVFLMRIVEPSSKQGWWITPGGAIDADESELEALAREIMEELGLDLSELGSPRAVWRRRVQFSWADQPIDQEETFYLVRCTRFGPPRCEDGDGADAYYVGEPRWWSVADLQTTSDNVAPADLATLLARQMRSDIPVDPIDISVERAM